MNTKSNCNNTSPISIQELTQIKYIRYVHRGLHMDGMYEIPIIESVANSNQNVYTSKCRYF